MFGTGSPPALLVTAGLHGDEQTGVYAARRLAQHLGSARLSGTVKIIAVANPPAFRRRRRTSPFDEIDLNRAFPGTPDGSPSQVLAHQIWGEARGMDCIVDLHCCGLWGTSYTLALCDEFRHARELAGRLDIPVVVQSSGQRGQLFVEACYAGTPAVIIELPGGQPGGVVDVAAGNRAAAALVGLLQEMEVMPGAAHRAAPAFYGKLKTVGAGGPGLFLPALAPGAPVRIGERLGTLKEEPILSPVDGIVVTLCPAQYLFTGDTIARLAPGPRQV